MYIHKTHTKKDLLKMMDILKVKVNGALSKREIIEVIPKLINGIDYPSNEYNIKNEDELTRYLKTKSPIKRLNADEKRIIMMKSKNIIHYAVEGYKLNQSVYDNHNEVMNDVVYIHSFGDIPSVRRACRLYNQDPNKINQVNPIIPEHILKELNNNRISKQSCYYGLIVKHEKVILYFD